METTQALLILIGVLQLLFFGIGSWVLLNVVQHGQQIATLTAEKDGIIKSMDEMKLTMNRIEKMLNAALGHRRENDLSS